MPPAPAPGGNHFGVPVGTPLITMNVEQRCVGFLIGPNGETIRQIREASGANTAIDQSTKNLGYSVCKIYGTQAQADLCSNLIKQKLAQKHASSGGGPLPAGQVPGLLPTNMPSSPLTALPAEEVPVDQRYVPFIVGKDGEALRSLQEETGTLITLDQSTKKQGHSTFKIQGVPEQTQATVQRIQAIVTHAQSLKWGNEVDIPDGQVDGPHELRVERAHVGRVVGKGGESINQIRELTGATVTVDDDVHFEGISFVRILPGPGADRAREMILAKVNRTNVSTAGLPGSTPGGVSMIGQPGGTVPKNFLTRDSDDSFMIDQWIVGYLIGKNGDTLKMLKDSTGAKIAIDQDPKDEGYSILRIGDKGSPENAKARQAINYRIQECHMQPKNQDRAIRFCMGLLEDLPMGDGNSALPTEPEDVLWVDQWMVGYLIGKGGEAMKKIREVTQAKIVVDQTHKDDGYSLLRISPAGSQSSMQALQILHEKVEEAQLQPQNRGKPVQYYCPPGGPGANKSLDKLGPAMLPPPLEHAKPMLKGGWVKDDSLGDMMGGNSFGCGNSFSGGNSFGCGNSFGGGNSSFCGGNSFGGCSKGQAKGSAFGSRLKPGMGFPKLGGAGPGGKGGGFGGNSFGGGSFGGNSFGGDSFQGDSFNMDMGMGANSNMMDMGAGSCMGGGCKGCGSMGGGMGGMGMDLGSGGGGCMGAGLGGMGMGMGMDMGSGGGGCLGGGMGGMGMDMGSTGCLGSACLGGMDMGNMGGGMMGSGSGAMLGNGSCGGMDGNLMGFGGCGGMDGNMLGGGCGGMSFGGGMSGGFGK